MEKQKYRVIVTMLDEKGESVLALGPIWSTEGTKDQIVDRMQELIDGHKAFNGKETPNAKL